MNSLSISNSLKGSVSYSNDVIWFPSKGPRIHYYGNSNSGSSSNDDCKSFMVFDMFHGLDIME